jgi:hypothetical protein
VVRIPVCVAPPSLSSKLSHPALVDLSLSAQDPNRIIPGWLCDRDSWRARNYSRAADVVSVTMLQPHCPTSTQSRRLTGSDEVREHDGIVGVGDDGVGARAGFQRFVG